MEGTFYEPELQVVHFDLTTEYHRYDIKEMCTEKEKGSPGKLAALVQDNSWIPEVDAKDYS